MNKRSSLAAIFTFALMAFALCATSHAASDTDVTIIKAKKVIIDGDTITIIAEAKTWMTVLTGSQDSKGMQFTGRSATRVTVKSDLATFIIRRPPERDSKGNDPLASAWQMTLDAAKELQAGNEVGRIGYYQPDVTIKGSLIVSVDGKGFLYPKGQ